MNMFILTDMLTGLYNFSTWWIFIKGNIAKQLYCCGCYIETATILSALALILFNLNSCEVSGLFVDTVPNKFSAVKWFCEPKRSIAQKTLGFAAVTM